MLIRVIEQQDNMVLYQIIRSILRDEKLALPGTAYDDDSLTHLSEYYETHQPGHYYVLVNDDGQVVGGAGFAPFSGKICELQKLYIIPQYRGKGYSKLLIEKIFEAAKQSYEEIYLETHHYLQKALYLYESMGFMSLSEPISGSEHSLMDRWMIKKLSL